jgi:hypothetical protein
MDEEGGARRAALVRPADGREIARAVLTVRG